MKIEELRHVWCFYVRDPSDCQARWWWEDSLGIFLSIFVKIRSLFCLSLMKLIDILLFLPFVIVWKGLNCITCKWRDLIFAHYLFISENEQNISGSRNEGGGAAPDGERQTIRETEKKCGVKGSWQHSIFYFFGLYWWAIIFPFTTPILVCVWWVEGDNKRVMTETQQD